jgi:hypothetical protein
LRMTGSSLWRKSGRKKGKSCESFFRMSEKYLRVRCHGACANGSNTPPHRSCISVAHLAARSAAGLRVYQCDGVPRGIRARSSPPLSSG